MVRWLLILAVTLIGLQSYPAYADESMSMQITMPLGGIMKNGEWTRIDVELTNEGPDFTGTLQLARNDFSPRNPNKYKQNVHVPAGEVKNYSFALPTELLLNGQIKVQLAQGETIITSNRVEQPNDSDLRQGAILDTNPNAFYFLSMKNEIAKPSNMMAYNMKSLPAQALPEESWLLRNLDLLIVGQVHDLSDKQIDAIKAWVHEGGELIISAGPNQDGVISKFQDILPIAPGHGGKLTDIDQLRDLSGQSNLPISSVAAYNTEQPLFVMKEVGNGHVLFVNYNVNEEPLASWQFNRQMWQKIFATYQLNADERSAQSLNPMDYSLISLSRVIPGVTLPSTIWLAVIWGIYILVVAPILYILLKRKDKREWAWGLVPLLAIMLSVGVYTIGRFQVSKQDASHSVSRINLIDEKIAKVTTTASFLAVSGGSYQVQTEPGFLSMPIDKPRGNWELDNTRIAMDENKGNALFYDQVPYLSEKQAVATGLVHNLGSFHYKLTVEKNKLVGSITNQTNFDMEQVYIDLGMQRVIVDTLKKGETKQVDQKLKEFYLSTTEESGNFAQEDKSEEQIVKEMKANLSASQPNILRISGISEQPLPVLHMVSSNLNQHYYNVFNQELNLSPGADGLIHYPAGTLLTDVIREDGMVNRNDSSMWEVGKGSVTFALDVSSADLRVKRVEIPFDQSPYRPFAKEIHNIKRNEWEDINREQRVVLENNLKDYLNKDGNIEVRMSNTTNQRLSLPEPIFTVDGEENQP